VTFVNHIHFLRISQIENYIKREQRVVPEVSVCCVLFWMLLEAVAADLYKSGGGILGIISNVAD
jgi:hypothetical protein